MIKNPNWQELTSLLFTKRGRVESLTEENKSKPCKPNALTEPRRLCSIFNNGWLVFTDDNFRKGDSLTLAALSCCMSRLHDNSATCLVRTQTTVRASLPVLLEKQ